MLKYHYRIIIWKLLIAVFFVFISLPCCAEEIRIKTIEKNSVRLTEFWLGEKLIGRIPQIENNSDFNIKTKAWAARLEDIFSKKPSKKEITVKDSATSSTICLRGNELFIFDKDMAKALNKTPHAAASQWAASIRFALSTAPFFTLKQDSIIIPAGGFAALQFSSNSCSNLAFLNYNPDEISISPDLQKKKLIITGKKPGSGKLTITAGTIQKSLSYYVRERAAGIPSQLVVQVSGNPAKGSIVTQALKSILNYSCFAKQGANITMDNQLTNAGSLYPGKSKSLVIPIHASGAGYLPAYEKVKINIENQPYSRPDPKYVLVSNKPEVIREDGEFFSSDFGPGQPARYFYHHKNAKGMPWRHFYITLENISSIPAKIFISPCGAGPTPDEIFAGHSAAIAYFENRKNGTGWFVTIKPQTKYILERRLAKPDETISGVGYLNIIEGARVKFICSASSISGTANNQAIPGQYQPENRPEPKTSKGVFSAFIPLSFEHEIGGKYTYIYLGGEPYQADITKGHPNYGNYGSFYDIDLNIANNRQGDRDAVIYFMPGGGAARGIFEIDGQLMETKLAQNGEKVLIKKVTVPQNSSKKVRIITMPQGGSYYPVKIVVESEFVKG